MAQNDELKTWKSICKVRYPNAPLLRDRRGAVVQQWRHKKSELTNWIINANLAAVHNPGGSTPQCELGAVTVVIESPAHQPMFRELATEFTFDVLNLLEIETIERVGLRLIHINRRTPKLQGAQPANRRSLYTLSDDD